MVFGGVGKSGGNLSPSGAWPALRGVGRIDVVQAKGAESGDLMPGRLVATDILGGLYLNIVGRSIRKAQPKFLSILRACWLG